MKNYTKFKIGDKVVCKRPCNAAMEKRLGVVGTVTEICQWSLKLSSPYNECFYSAKQFDLFKPQLENK